MKTWSLQCNSTTATVMDAHDNKVRDLHRRIMAGEKVYVKFTEYQDERRTDSIAYISKFSIREDYPYHHRSYYAKAPPKGKSRPAITTMQVAWEGRKNTLSVWIYDILVLTDYAGPSVWKWEKPVGPLVVAKDRTGRVIKKGDFINYVLHHHVSYGTTIHFGTVSKIDRDGTVWAKNVKVDDKETVAEKRIKNNENIVVLTKDLLDRLMLLKLAS